MIGEQYAVAGRRRASTPSRAKGSARIRSRVSPERTRYLQLREETAPSTMASPPTRGSLLSRVFVQRPLALLQDLGRSVLVQLLLAMSFVALAALLYLLQASQGSVLAVNIANLQVQRSQLVAQNASLRATATSLQSFRRIDDIATRQLHMTKIDLSNTIWLRPTVPPVGTLQGTTAGTTYGPSGAPLWVSQMVAAQHRSEPRGWIERLAAFVKSSL